MEHNILGLHHITAIAGDPKVNFDFYTKVLGLRFIKRTVNFDDPGTYHFYFGDESRTPGTILTFFPWGKGIPQGRRGAGMATEIAYSVPEGSLGFWKNRLEEHHVIYNNAAKKFGESYLTFLDPDGLKLELTEVPGDGRAGWQTDGIAHDVALRGFHAVTLTLNDVKPTAGLLEGVLGYRLAAQEVNRYRFVNENVTNARFVDLVELPSEQRGHVANGTVHHVAVRVSDDEGQRAVRGKIDATGLSITHPIDRNYFRSLYFREPGGVLFEIATDSPGFTVDEPIESLGSSLMLPATYEGMREEIEARLIPLD